MAKNMGYFDIQSVLTHEIGHCSWIVAQWCGWWQQCSIPWVQGQKSELSNRMIYHGQAMAIQVPHITLPMVRYPATLPMAMEGNR